uniref:Cwf21 domain-containing protein n=1 Tax=Meloidogyne hapla TaxID=6305 RepID=A0A1I8B158_MELHA
MGHVIKKSDYENAVVLNVSRKRSPSPRGRPVTDEMGELINASKGLQLKVQQLEANLEQQGFELERVKAERDKLARAVDLIISGSNQAFEKFKSSVPNWCKVDNNGNLLVDFLSCSFIALHFSVLILAGATGDDTGEGAEDQIYGVFRGVQAPKESKSNNGVQESTVQSSSGVQESTVQSSSGVQESTVQESTVQESTVQSSSGVQESTVQSNSGVQESTVQESTVQSSSGVQESTVQSNSGR